MEGAGGCTFKLFYRHGRACLQCQRYNNSPEAPVADPTSIPIDDFISYWAHPKNHYHCEYFHENYFYLCNFYESLNLKSLSNKHNLLQGLLQRPANCFALSPLCVLGVNTEVTGKKKGGLRLCRFHPWRTENIFFWSTDLHNIKHTVWRDPRTHSYCLITIRTAWVQL